MSKKKWKYHKSHSFIDGDGEKTEGITQLYKIGVYFIINNDPYHQFNTTPAGMVEIENTLKELEGNSIMDLQFGQEITVIEKDGFFVEEKQEVVCPNQN